MNATHPPDSSSNSVSDEARANDRSGGARWVGLLGWGLGWRLLLAAGLLAVVWAAVVWALV